jgi:hypothetical protein
VKRFLAAIAGGMGLGALHRRFRGGRSPGPSEGTEADELRAKLAESRQAEESAEAEAVAEDPEEAEPSDVDVRRRDVHDRARQAIDELA